MDSLATLGRHAETVMMVLVSIVGAALGYISRQWRAGKTIKLSRMMFAVMASVFIMAMTSTLCNIMGFSYNWTILIVGVFSWMGTDASIVILERAVYKKLGISHVYVKTGANTSSVNSLKPGGVYDLQELQENGLGAIEYQGTLTDLARELTGTSETSSSGPTTSTDPAVRSSED